MSEIPCASDYEHICAVNDRLDVKKLTQPTGTAFFVAPVGLIEWKGKQLRIPTSEGSTGKYAGILRGWLEDIMYGRGEAHEWGVVVNEVQ